MSSTSQTDSQYRFGPTGGGGGDVIQFTNFQNQIISWIDNTGHLQGNLLSTGATDGTPGTILGYNYSNGYFTFTNTSGGFNPVLGFLYSPQDAVGGQFFISVNTDGQVNFTNFNSTSYPGNFSSQLILDEDGACSLIGGGGGGVGADHSTGDTFLSPTFTGSQTGQAQTTSPRWSSSGLFHSYLGLGLAGNGQPTIAAVVNGSATGTVSNFLVWTTPASGYGSSEYYEASWVGVVTGAAAGATAVATWAFTDASGANTVSSASLPFAANGNRIELTSRFQLTPSSTLKLSVTCSGGSPTYSSNLRVTIF